MTGTLLRFLENYCAPVTQKYWALKKEELLNRPISPFFVFCNYVILGGHILNISKTIFTQQIFHRRLCDQLPHVLLQAFYIYSTSVIHLCL